MQIEKENNLYLFKQEQVVNQKLINLFPFFEKPENLSTLTPNWLSFKIKTALPLEMKEGAEFEYIIKLFGIPMYWKTRITKYSPPYSFTDEQLKGPYKKWTHIHTFEEKDGKVLMKDQVEFDLYGGFLKQIIYNILIKRSIDKIFQFRKIAIEKEFPEIINS